MHQFHQLKAPVRLRSNLIGTVLAGLLAACSSGGTEEPTGSAGARSGGIDGEDGLDGANGADGQDGTNGTDGESGTDGVDGTNGANGTNGVDGDDGADGVDGIDGDNGADGEDGVDGVSPGPVAIFGNVPKKKVVTTAAAHFTFGCSYGDCAYESSIDGSEWLPVESPLSLTGLTAGEHVVRLRAKSTDPADTLGFGNTTSYSFTARKPNILTIVADDLGYSDIGALGSEIETPNLDELANTGRILARHQVGTVCAITRAMLISGTDHHLAGQGTMGGGAPEHVGKPGYEGYLNDRSLSVAQLLQDGGYNTYISGKWHLGSRLVGGTTGSGKTADQWGFDRSFTILGGGVGNHFMHNGANATSHTLDGVYSRPGVPGHPADGTFSADYLTDKLIEFIDDGLEADPDKPFFGYAAYLSPHWPLQAPDEWIDKYKGKYDDGYTPVAAARLERLKDLGIIPRNTTLSGGFNRRLTASAASPANGTAAAKYVSAVNSVAEGFTDYGSGAPVKDWDDLTAAEKKAQSRYMEIYAGMVDHLDYSIGRLIQHLKDIDEYEYTFILFSSDSGAEGWPSSANPQTWDETNASDATFPTLGRDNGTANVPRNLHYGIRWAEASNTPNSQVKSYQGVGGLTAPAIVHLPGQTEALPAVRHFTHVTDVTATVLDLADVAHPSTPAPELLQDGVNLNAGKVLYDDRIVNPITGLSFLALLSERAPGPLHTEAVGGETYGRAFILSANGRWRARWTEPAWGPVDGHWELFDLANDVGETNDLSSVYPGILAGLIVEWEAYLARVGAVYQARPGGFF